MEKVPPASAWPASVSSRVNAGANFLSPDAMLRLVCKSFCELIKKTCGPTASVFCPTPIRPVARETKTATQALDNFSCTTVCAINLHIVLFDHLKIYPSRCCPVSRSCKFVDNDHLQDVLARAKLCVQRQRSAHNDLFGLARLRVRNCQRFGINGPAIAVDRKPGIQL